MTDDQLTAEGSGPLLDPDCRDGKHTSCVGEPCECACHGTGATPDALSSALMRQRPQLAGHVHYVNGRPWCDGVNHTTMCREGEPVSDLPVTAPVPDWGQCHRYLVTAPLDLRMNTWAATAMFTNWLEGRGLEERQTWLVTCFDNRRESFLAAARTIGVTVEEISGAGDDEHYILLVGEPGSGWTP